MYYVYIYFLYIYIYMLIVFAAAMFHHCAQSFLCHSTALGGVQGAQMHTYIYW